MTFVLFGLIAAAAIAITVVSARRAAADRDAVARQRHTLDVIADITGRAAPPAPPQAPRLSHPPPPDRRPAPPQAPRLSHPPPPDRRPAPPIAPPLSNRYQPRHRRSAPRRPAVVVVLVALAVVAAGSSVLLLQRRTGGGRPEVASHPLGDTTGSGSKVTTPPTTGAPVVAVMAEGASQATFRLRSVNEAVLLVPTGICWVKISSSQGVMLARALRPGARQNVSLNAGPVTVLLGNPVAMTLLVDGTSVSIPGMSGHPYTLVFEIA